MRSARELNKLLEIHGKSQVRCLKNVKTNLISIVSCANSFMNNIKHYYYCLQQNCIEKGKQSIKIVMNNLNEKPKITLSKIYFNFIWIFKVFMEFRTNTSYVIILTDRKRTRITIKSLFVAAISNKLCEMKIKNTFRETIPFILYAFYNGRASCSSFFTLAKRVSIWTICYNSLFTFYIF